MCINCICNRNIYINIIKSAVYLMTISKMLNRLNGKIIKMGNRYQFIKKFTIFFYVRLKDAAPFRMFSIPLLYIHKSPLKYLSHLANILTYFNTFDTLFVVKIKFRASASFPSLEISFIGPIGTTSERSPLKRLFRFT